MEPKPIVTLRFAVSLFLAVVVGFVGASFFVSGNRASEDCAMRNSSSRQTTIDFTFVPPGYDCVYLNRRGKEVGRSRR